MTGTSPLPWGDGRCWCKGHPLGCCSTFLTGHVPLSSPCQGPNAYNNTALFEESGLIRITLGASTISSVSSVRSARTHSSQRAYLR